MILAIFQKSNKALLFSSENIELYKFYKERKVFTSFRSK